MQIILETKRLLLRTWQPDDAADAFAIWGNHEVMRYVGQPLEHLDAARRTLERAVEAQALHGVSLWAVTEKTTGEIVGACGFHFEAEGPEFELAYHFKPDHWRRGFATEAAQACVLYAFETLGATKIIAGVKTDNPASLRVLEKLGFTQDRLNSPLTVDEQLFSIRQSSEI